MNSTPKQRKRKRTVPRWAVGPAYSTMRLMVSVANTAGIEPSMRSMRRLGGAWAQQGFNQKRFARAISNIEWCFPEWDAQQAHRCATEAYRHLFALATEVALAPRLLNQDGYMTHVELGDLGKAVDVLCADHPRLLITGHCGNWEFLGYTLALLGFSLHGLYRPLDMKPLDEWLFETRQRRGLTLVDKFGAARAMPQLMESNASLGFIADQNAGDRGLFVPFFNRLASTYKAIGLLAARHDATIICGHARRLSGMNVQSVSTNTVDPVAPVICESQLFKYAIEIVDIIRPEDWKDQPDPVYYITARYRRAIEVMVRRAPEQYLWMHRYWKSRPLHERASKPFPPGLREKIGALPWMTSDTLEQIVERSNQDAVEFARNRASR